MSNLPEVFSYYSLMVILKKITSFSQYKKLHAIQKENDLRMVGSKSGSHNSANVLTWIRLPTCLTQFNYWKKKNVKGTKNIYENRKDKILMKKEKQEKNKETNKNRKENLVETNNYSWGHLLWNMTCFLKRWKK